METLIEISPVIGTAIFGLIIYLYSNRKSKVKKKDER